MNGNLSKTQKSVYGALMCTIIVICSQITLPMPSGIPFTLQTFAIALAGGMLGKKQGILVYMVYLILGLCGFPVFSGFTGGISKFFGITGGFLWGFCFIVLLSAVARQKTVFACIGLSLIAVALCHLCGIIQFSYISGTSFKLSFFIVSAPYMVKDIISFIFACKLSDKLKGRFLKWHVKPEK